MRDLVTPRQVAQAIQVSESSVKRWCDKGVIPTCYTAGGHRRIPLSGLLDFLRASRRELLHPTRLGLPSVSQQGRCPRELATSEFAQALLAADETRCRQIAVELFLSAPSVSAICDDVIAAAFAEVGQRWACGDVEVYQERLACEIAHRVLNDLRALVPEPDPAAPQAIGGCPPGDFYTLGTSMAELVLRDAGWRSVSLGTNLPYETLAAAIRQRRPQLFWLSCSHLAEDAELVRGYAVLVDALEDDVTLVLGGQAVTPSLLDRMPRVVSCATMRELESLARPHQPRGVQATGNVQTTGNW
jgi:methanogenic corrinoid protein MtbC1